MVAHVCSMHTIVHYQGRVAIAAFQPNHKQTCCRLAKIGRGMQVLNSIGQILKCRTVLLITAFVTALTALRHGRHDMTYYSHYCWFVQVQTYAWTVLDGSTSVAAQQVSAIWCTYILQHTSHCSQCYRLKWHYQSD